MTKGWDKESLRHSAAKRFGKAPPYRKKKKVWLFGKLVDEEKLGRANWIESKYMEDERGEIARDAATSPEDVEEEASSTDYRDIEDYDLGIRQAEAEKTTPKLTIADVKRINAEKGQYYFTSDTMRFFKSRIESELYNNKYFITSEQSPEMERKYSIRKFDKDTGSISTVGEFQAYNSKQSAKEALKKVK